MREDPWEDLGYSRLPALAGICAQTLPVDPAPPPWVVAGMTWREWAGHRCEDHDDA